MHRIDLRASTPWITRPRILHMKRGWTTAHPRIDGHLTDSIGVCL